MVFRLMVACFLATLPNCVDDDVVLEEPRLERLIADLCSADSARSKGAAEAIDRVLGSLPWRPGSRDHQLITFRRETKPALAELIKHLEAEDDRVFRTVCSLLSALGSDALPAIGPLEALLQSVKTDQDRHWTVLSAISAIDPANKMLMPNLLMLFKKELAIAQLPPRKEELLRMESDEWLAFGAQILAADLFPTSEHVKAALPAVITALNEDDRGIRKLAFGLLTSMTGPWTEEAMPALIQAQLVCLFQGKIEACRDISKLIYAVVMNRARILLVRKGKNQTYVSSCIWMFEHDFPLIQEAAIGWVREVGPCAKQAVPNLKELLLSDSALREYARRALDSVEPGAVERLQQMQWSTFRGAITIADPVRDLLFLNTLWAYAAGDQVRVEILKGPDSCRVALSNSPAMSVSMLLETDEIQLVNLELGLKKRTANELENAIVPFEIQLHFQSDRYAGWEGVAKFDGRFQFGEVSFTRYTSSHSGSAPDEFRWKLNNLRIRQCPEADRWRFRKK